MTDASELPELLGRTTTREFVVSDADTAAAVGSGSLAVLGTPVLLAWCEAVTCAVLDLPDGSTSVGTRVALEHLAASRVGAAVAVTATVTYADGRLVRFAVEARDTGSQKLLGTGEITRVVVDVERFLGRL
ncbi:thioesterase family protein [Marmoricola sp. RAF53]|uniref:thioesterase family protein n=1 Tax=Marmoricola sp. RAF53 TaxID=3233059 RepID=UPI003F9A1544